MDEYENAAACVLHRWSNTLKLASRYKYTGSVKEHDHFWNVVVAIGRLETYVVIGQRVHEDSPGYSRKKTGSMCTQCR